MKSILLGIVAAIFIIAGSLYLAEIRIFAAPDRDTVSQSQVSFRSSQVQVRTPQRIVVPSAHIDLAVKQGNYNPTLNSWDLDDTYAFSMTGSATPIVYGHATKNVFAEIGSVKPSDKLIVYYDDGSQVTMVNTKSRLIDQDDVSVAKEYLPQTMILLTCAGFFDEYRRVVYFEAMT